jgi:hypothetical protein
MNTQLIFVYNANGGLFNMAADWLHKIFSPKTYPCSLCALTYGHFGERQEWKRFITSLDEKPVFLHQDELTEQYPNQKFKLPCVLRRQGNNLFEVISAKELNAMSTLEALKNSVSKL